jgi:hypothetical protein
MAIIPKEDFIKSGYKPDMKYKYLIVLLIFWLLIENQTQKSDDYYFWLLKMSKFTSLPTF